MLASTAGGRPTWYTWPIVALDRIIPTPSTLRDPKLVYYFAASIVVLHSIFHILSNTVYQGSDPKRLKQRAWILTTVNAFVMTTVSLPFLWDLLWSGFDLHAVRHREEWILKPFSSFFVAYLLSDLGLGSIYYRHLINFSSGWVHHSVYTFLFAFWMHKGWIFIAVMACVFELPTFIMGIASLHPPLRSNSLFTGTFFITRVFFHFGLLIATCTHHGRATPGIDGSWGPAISVLVTYPMHLWWGYKCILSTRRRMHKRKAERRKEREALLASLKQGGLATYFDAAGQLLNGLPDPQISSALNTPATTPGSSPLLTPADKRPPSPFQRAAAVAGNPIKLVLGGGGGSSGSSSNGAGGRKRRDSDVSEKSFSLNDGTSVVANGSSNEASAVKRHPFTAAVRPEGAQPEDREPFLAIRSPAETRDKARRLVADVIRKAWTSAPESWRKQFEAEVMAAFDNTAPKVPIASSSAVSASEENSSGEEMDGEHEAITPMLISTVATPTTELAVDPIASSSSIDSAPTPRDERTRTQRGKDAARRALVRAVRRAINGKDTRDFATAVAAKEGEGEARVEAAVQEDQRNERRLLQSIVGLGGFQLPPDMIGQDYSVREFPVERDATSSRHQRILGQLRRRMEVANREVVVFD